MSIRGSVNFHAMVRRSWKSAVEGQFVRCWNLSGKQGGRGAQRMWPEKRGCLLASVYLPETDTNMLQLSLLEPVAATWN